MTEQRIIQKVADLLRGSKQRVSIVNGKYRGKSGIVIGHSDGKYSVRLNNGLGIRTYMESGIRERV